MEHDITLNLVSVLLALLFIAAVSAIISRRIKFPFSILLVFIGLMIGGAAKGLPLLKPMLLLKLTPETVLFVFLPVLLFESSFNLDARGLLKNIIPISVLAVPALLISTAVVGVIVHLLLGLPMGISLLFGALISATDPVAVVALFREMGAPKRLHLLVEGESLFNDGTALVVFRIILGVVLAGSFSSMTLFRGIADFVVVALGGLATGIVTGFLFAKLIEQVRNDRLVEITLTTILAHSTFLAAEHLLHVSGVIATVSAGLTMGSYGRSKISPPVLEHMEAFWEYFAFVCNALIFLLVGLSIDIGLFLDNIGAVFIAAIAVIVARAAGVYTLFPVIERFRLAERVSPAFQTVIFWGGLRGALAIVMVLSVPDTLPEKSFLLVLTLGVVLFSLFVNGLSIRKLIDLLGLNAYTLKEHFEKAQAELEARAKVQAMVPVYSEEELIEKDLFMKWLGSYRGKTDVLLTEIETLKKKIPARDEYEVLFRHLLYREKKKYLEMFESGMLREDNFRSMQRAIDRQVDRLKEGGEIYRPGIPPMISRIVHFFSAYPCFRLLTGRYKTGRIAAWYEMEHARYAAASAILKEIDQIEQNEEMSGTVLAEARDLYNGLREKALSRINDMRTEYPEYVEKVEQGMVMRLSLCIERDTYRKLHSEGAIPDRFLAEMEERIERTLRKMKLRPVKELVFPPSKLIKMVPYFSELSDEELKRLTLRLSARSFITGEEIVKQGEESDALYIIGRGKVEVVREDDQRAKRALAYLRSGDFFGETALLYPQPRTATVRALVPCTLLELKREKFMPFLEHAPYLRKALEEAHRARERERKADEKH